MTEQSTNRRYDNLYQSKPQIITSSTLPTIGARDGDTFRYKATAAVTGAQTNVVWTFLYDAADGYWYSQCAAPLTAFVTGSTASSLTNTWQDTVTPKFTLPFSGDYDAAASALCTQTTTSGISPEMGILINGTGTPLLFSEMTVTAVTWPATLALPSVAFTGLTAGNTLSLGIFTQDATPAHTTFAQRILRVTPIRVH